MALSNAQLEILYRKLQQLQPNNIRIEGNTVKVGNQSINFNSADTRQVVSSKIAISR